MTDGKREAIKSTDIWRLTYNHETCEYDVEVIGLEECEAERDAYREALEDIMVHEIWRYVGRGHVEDTIKDIARRALEKE